MFIASTYSFFVEFSFQLRPQSHFCLSTHEHVCSFLCQCCVFRRLPVAYNIFW